MGPPRLACQVRVWLVQDGGFQGRPPPRCTPHSPLLEASGAGAGVQRTPGDSKRPAAQPQPPRPGTAVLEAGTGEGATLPHPHRAPRGPSLQPPLPPVCPGQVGTVPSPPSSCCPLQLLTPLPPLLTQKACLVTARSTHSSASWHLQRVPQTALGNPRHASLPWALALDPSRDWVTVDLPRALGRVSVLHSPDPSRAAFFPEARQGLLCPRNCGLRAHQSLLPKYESVLQPPSFGTIPKSNSEQRKGRSLPSRGPATPFSTSYGEASSKGQHHEVPRGK